MRELGGKLNLFQRIKFFLIFVIINNLILLNVNSEDIKLNYNSLTKLSQEAKIRLNLKNNIKNPKIPNIQKNYLHSNKFHRLQPILNKYTLRSNSTLIQKNQKIIGSIIGETSKVSSNIIKFKLLTNLKKEVLVIGCFNKCNSGIQVNSTDLKKISNAKQVTADGLLIGGTVLIAPTIIFAENNGTNVSITSPINNGINQVLQKGYFVSPSGSDSNSGKSEVQAFRSIQKAADFVKAGETVYIMNGTYTNTPINNLVTVKSSGLPNSWITFTAYPGHHPVLKFDSWTGVFMGGGISYIRISDLEVIGNNANITLAYAQSQQTNTSNGATGGSGIAVDARTGGHSHHIDILRNKVHDCGGGGISAIQSDYIKVDNNIVYNNAWYSIWANSGISIYQAYNSDSFTGYKNYITNNISFNNREYLPWITTGTITDGNGIIYDDSKNTQNNSALGKYNGRTLIANNVVFNNGGSGIHSYSSEHVDIINNTAYLNNQTPENNGGQIFANDSADVKIYNNILQSSPSKKINTNWNNTNVTVDYNMYFGSAQIDVKGAHDIIADPQFINPTTDPSQVNLNVKNTSPAIDKGAPFAEVSADINGTQRPQRLSTDIGAYEN